MGAAVVVVAPATVTGDPAVEAVGAVVPSVTTVDDPGTVVVFATDVGDTIVVVDDAVVEVGASVVVVGASVVDVVEGGVQSSSSRTLADEVAASPFGHVARSVNTIVPVTPPGVVVVAEVELPPGTTALYPVTAYGVMPTAAEADTIVIGEPCSLFPIDHVTR